MSVFEWQPENPVELAEISAKEIVKDEIWGTSDAEQFTLAALDSAADGLGFIGTKYFVQSYKSLAVPFSYQSNEKPSDEEEPYFEMPGLSFEGQFATYSKAAIGRIIGERSVRALCLSFVDVTLLPFFDKIPDRHFIIVPVLAVSDISSMEAA